ncbi:MAG: hypothetical protein LUO90_03055 [Methanoregula sp.]|nr:hypothetical protein [Methanoregula sp.]
MSERKDPGVQWRQTSVVIRADIFFKAAEMGLDISNECNQALAHLVGIDYRQQQINQTTPGPQPPILHPVINAEDPTAIAKVRKTKRQPSVKSVPETPVPFEILMAGTSVPHQIPSSGRSPAGKGKTTAAEKKGKEETVKKFVATKIIRTDAADAVITKDDMYQAFMRWSRDYRCAAVPERKAFATLLKNKFAITEKTVNGTPTWVNVHLK